MRFKKNWNFWIVALVSLIMDHLTKLWVVQNFEPGETLPLWHSVFHLTYVTNTGAAFSLFSNGGILWLRWLSLLVSLGLMAMAWFGPRQHRWEQIGYGLILGGALGNGIDRFISGHVVDFLDFRLINFPIFNLADISINIGIWFLIIATFTQLKPES
ncbi:MULTISPECIES: signal peptidase II [Planktothrix]|jgi:signal peptidase II|uniref:Lipoprotein signal peptidase n=2 Tax=Planktothrix TaxID=54304 RepID=A0A4P5ZDF8_PLAAG|nr:MULTISPECIES: signal peptidase II [Planktothrix]CAD5923092.1 Lipoprotein signal peptidase [Planktothrix rubescens]MCF3578949.1 signal peptidase II [Planktothrix agardhii 1811]MCF3579332.1 signal peptidase II [Planktothrix agardhii 1811]MCF3627173.1 signal peptidase II [Planktothrix agardhii 1801]CAC5340324.1 Lipoprotein signal peptidase [Planktothrix rubescens NIVA-CYA 18]